MKMHQKITEGTDQGKGYSPEKKNPKISLSCSVYASDAAWGDVRVRVRDSGASFLCVQQHCKSGST